MNKHNSSAKMRLLEDKEATSESLIFSTTLAILSVHHIFFADVTFDCFKR